MREIIDDIRIEKLQNGYILYPNFRYEGGGVSYSTNERLVFKDLPQLGEYLEFYFNVDKK